MLLLGGKSLGKSFLLRSLMAELATELTAQQALETSRLEDAARMDREAASMRDQGAIEAAGLREQQAAKRRDSPVGIHPRKPCRVVLYNARHDGPDLVPGLLKAFSGDPSFFEKFAGTLGGISPALGLAGEATAFFGGPAAAFFSGGPGAVLAAQAAKIAARSFAAFMVAKKPILSDVMEAFVVACEEEGSFPCLIVDEANVALEAPNSEATDRTLVALRILTEYTKERRRMNVILSASEYSEPYRLSELGFKSDHFSRTVLMPEVSPKDMRELLERKWGMGPNLATAFMSVWGGHVWATFNGLSLLASGKGSFSAIQNPIAFSSDAVDGVTDCLAADSAASPMLAATTEEGGSMTGMVDLLKKLATHGYAMVPSRKDPRAKLISERNVGGVVTANTLAPGVPPDAWLGRKRIVVATNQAMRMLLATELYDLK